MDLSTGPRLHHLDQAVPGRSVLKIERARGARVACIAGEVWITEDGRQDDVVLKAGENTVLGRAGLAMITPFGSADVEIEFPERVAIPPFRSVTADTPPREHYIDAARRMRAQAMVSAFAGAIRWLRARVRPADRNACCA